MTTITATKSHARVDVADVLRGFAVLGIILLHCIEHFNFYRYPDPSEQGPFLAFTDQAIWDGMFFTFGGKAYAIFALLFGFSFFIQNDNSRMRGKDFRARFAWRLLLLFIIGNINACFFTGEILVMYSLIGFVLILTCRLSTRTLIILAIILMLQPVALFNTIMASLSPDYVTPAIPSSHHWGAVYEMQANGTFWATVKANFVHGQLASLIWAWDHGRIFQTAGLFITGMLIGRQGWFLKSSLSLWGKVLATAMILFFPLHGLDSMLPQYIENPNILSPLKIIVQSLANLSFMSILTSGVIFAYYSTTRISRILSKLIPYGRMSMTNYVTQSIVGSFIFYNWGLGLGAGKTASFGIGILLFILQYSFCRWWMGSHHHGPMEWLWKKATWIDQAGFLRR